MQLLPAIFKKINIVFFIYYTNVCLNLISFYPPDEIGHFQFCLSLFILLNLPTF